MENGATSHEKMLKKSFNLKLPSALSPASLHHPSPLHVPVWSKDYVCDDGSFQFHSGKLRENPHPYRFKEAWASVCLSALGKRTQGNWPSLSPYYVLGVSYIFSSKLPTALCAFNYYLHFADEETGCKAKGGNETWLCVTSKPPILRHECRKSTETNIRQWKKRLTVWQQHYLN